MSGAPRHARGAVLTITLVMLTLVTLLTTAAMQTARDQVIRAAGREFIDDAFEACEYGIALALRQPSFDTTAPVTLTAPATVNAHRITATTRFLGRTAAIPHRAWRPVRHAGLAAYHFEVIATARGPRRTVGVHRQQFFIVSLAAAPAIITIPAPPVRLGLPGGPVRTVWRADPGAP
jgi:hypothetical protein